MSLPKIRNAYLCKYWAAKKQGDAARFVEAWKTRYPGGTAPKYMRRTRCPNTGVRRRQKT